MKLAASFFTERQTLPRRPLASLLFVLGALALLAAGVLAGGVLLSTWLREQERYMVLQEVAPLSAPELSTPSLKGASTTMPAPSPTPTDKLPATVVPTASPPPTPTATTAPPVSRTPARIRIPALKVDRSIISVPPVLDPKTGATTRNVDKLFRPGRKDLVGHWEGSALPGQDGNMILVGHNYGVGYNGVFVRLGRLKEGQQVIVMDEAGTPFTYRVDKVQRVKWRQKDSKELEAHWKYMSPGGPERLTLVTCGGANIEPFPDRIYVVAYPVP